MSCPNVDAWLTRSPDDDADAYDVDDYCPGCGAPLNQPAGACVERHYAYVTTYSDGPEEVMF